MCEFGEFVNSSPLNINKSSNLSNPSVFNICFFKSKRNLNSLMGLGIKDILS